MYATHTPVCALSNLFTLLPRSPIFQLWAVAYVAWFVPQSALVFNVIALICRCVWLPASGQLSLISMPAASRAIRTKLQQMLSLLWHHLSITSPTHSQAASWRTLPATLWDLTGRGQQPLWRTLQPCSMTSSPLLQCHITLALGSL